MFEYFIGNHIVLMSNSYLIRITSLIHTDKVTKVIGRIKKGKRMSFNIVSVTLASSCLITTRKQLKPSKYDDTVCNNVPFIKIFQIAKSIFTYQTPNSKRFLHMVNDL